MILKIFSNHNYSLAATSSTPATAVNDPKAEGKREDLWINMFGQEKDGLFGAFITQIFSAGVVTGTSEVTCGGDVGGGGTVNPEL